MRNSLDSLPDVIRVEKPVSVDRFMSGVGKQRKTHFALAVFGDFRRQTFAFFGIVNADRQQRDRFILFEQTAQLG